MKEEKIIEGLKARDRKALEAFNKRYRNHMIRVAAKVVKSEMEAEDVVQECFLKILSGIDKFDPENSFKGWLWKIVHNASLTHYQREKKHRGADIDGYEPMQVKIGSCFDAMAASDLYRSAMRMLQKNSPGMYMYVRLHFEEQMNYEEISKDLEMNIGTVKSQVSRGASKIREYIKELEFVELKNIA
jgi:RNA polymerase sigma-70 factor (ECF subfamily)